MTVLKMVAYLDRPEARLKDLRDLTHMLLAYSHRRTPHQAWKEVPAEITEYDELSPYFLGRDLSALVDAVERQHVLEFLEAIEKEERRPHLLALMSSAEPAGWRDPDIVLMTLHAFRRGFSAVRGSA